MVCVPRFCLLQVTLSKLSVSADANDLLLDNAETTELVGQTLGTSDKASLENYWILILCSIVLLILWSCCFYWVREGFRTAAGGVRWLSLRGGGGGGRVED